MSLHQALGCSLLSRTPLITTVYPTSREHLPYYSHRLKKKKQKKSSSTISKKGVTFGAALPVPLQLLRRRVGGPGRAARLFDLFWATGAQGRGPHPEPGSAFIWFSASTCLGAGLLIIAAAAERPPGAGGPPGRRAGAGTGEGVQEGEAGLPPGAPSAQSGRGLFRKSSRNSQPGSLERPGCWKPPGPPLPLSFPWAHREAPAAVFFPLESHSEPQ